MKEITKISIKNDKVSIGYILLQNNDNDTHEVNFYSYDNPDPEFLKELQSLDEDVVEIMELDDDYKSGLEITGVSIKHEEHGTGCCIQAIKKLNYNNAPLCINTPYKPPSRNGDKLDSKCIGENLSDKLERLENFANSYLEGEREQKNLL